MNVYTPPGAPPVKKGLSPLAWVGIGCGIIILLGCVVLGVLGFFAKKQFDKFADNPGKAAAELMVKANPDLELVSTDDKAGTMTIKDKKTGDVVTMNFDDIKNGKFQIKTKDGTANFDANSQDGTVKVTDDKGNSTFQMGAGANANLPSWVPAYGNGKTTPGFSASKADEKSGTYTVTTSDSAETVMSFYESKLKDGGFTVNKTSFPGGGNVTGNSADDKRTFNVMIGNNNGETSAVVTYSEKP